MTVAKYGFSLLLQQHDIIIYIIIKIFETFYISFIYQLFFFFFTYLVFQVSANQDLKLQLMCAPIYSPISLHPITLN